MVFKWPFQIQNLSSYSSLDSEEKDSGGEATFFSQKVPPQYSTRQLDRHRLFLNIIHSISVIFVTTSIILTFAINFTLVRRTPPELQPPYGNPIKSVPLELKTFGPSEIFTERQSERSDAAWDSLAGPTKSAQGFIYIPNARELNLPPGSQHEGGELYGISMFHQLHCLGAIRQVFWQLMDGRLDPIEFAALDGDTTSPDYVPDGHGLWHIKHCFNYIRHALQCAGDTTIELPTMFNGQKIFIGWNTTHQCRNYETVWEYALNHS